MRASYGRLAGAKGRGTLREGFGPRSDGRARAAPPLREGISAASIIVVFQRLSNICLFERLSGGGGEELYEKSIVN